MERLKKLRQKIKLSQEKLGKIFNVNQSTILTWEKGQKEPDYITLKKIAKYFNVSIDYLLGVEEEQEENNGITYPQRFIEVNEEEKEMIKKYKNSDAWTKQAINKLLDINNIEMLNKNKNSK